MHNLLATRSTCAAASTTRGTGAGAGIGTAMSAGAISPAARFRFHGVPCIQRRDELEIPTLQLWASPNVPRFCTLHFWRHDQHLITAVSATDECSILQLGIQISFSCTSRAIWHEVHSFSKFNQLSAVRLAYMQFASCATVTTNLTLWPQIFLRAPRRNGRMGRLEGTSHFSLSSNALFITLTCFCISRTVTSMVSFD